MDPLSTPGLAQYLTPEMADRLANVAYIPDEQQALQQQMELALALRRQPERSHMSAMAAGIDGLGDLTRNITSFAQENKIRGQQAGLRDQQKSAYGDYLKQLFQQQALRGQQPAQQELQQVYTPMMAMGGT